MRRPFAVLACLVSTMFVAGTASVATAAPSHNRGLTINATPNPIGAGEGVLIYGQLNRRPLAGQTISLYHRVGTQPKFTFIQRIRTDAFGFYRFIRAEGVVTTNRSWFVRGPRRVAQPHRERAGRRARQHQRRRNRHRHEPRDHIQWSGHSGAPLPDRVVAAADRSQ